MKVCGGVVGGKCSASRPSCLAPSEKTSGSNWIGGLVGPWTSLDEAEKRKILPLSGLKLQPLSCPACSQPLYRLAPNKDTVSLWHICNNILATWSDVCWLMSKDLYIGVHFLASQHLHNDVLALSQCTVNMPLHFSILPSAEQIVPCS